MANQVSLDRKSSPLRHKSLRLVFGVALGHQHWFARHFSVLRELELGSQRMRQTTTCGVNDIEMGEVLAQA